MSTEEVEAYLKAIPTLERVVVPPAVLPVEAEPGGGRRYVTSVEIWSNCFVIRTADVAVDPTAVPASDWLAQGQVGGAEAHYQFIEGCIVGSELVRFGYALYTPKPPDDLQVLSVRLPMTSTFVMIYLVDLTPPA
jgi:hypothetical protein